jgi:SAM-dependent methyltransferase
MEIKNNFNQDAETEFLSGLIELGYGLDVINKLKNVSNEVDWAKNWPKDNISFWNAEAFMWNYKISKEKREIISYELDGLDNNLDIGCGAYSYIKSVGFDFSYKMLQFNSNCLKKVQGDLNLGLPFNSGSFSSVTAIFVLNYVKNLDVLFSEVKRVLGSGEFVVILSPNINSWQKQKQVHTFSFLEWMEKLDSMFKVEAYEKEGLWFYRCSF